MVLEGTKIHVVSGCLYRCCFSINPRKKKVFQNFLDFRYFRRYFKLKNIVWIPGSGGVKRKIGSSDNVVLVSRDDKVSFAVSSIKSFLKKRENVTLDIVGCKDELLIKELLLIAIPIFSGMLHRIICLSVVSFSYSPQVMESQSLVDALVSGMNVFIQQNLFIEFGLHVIGFEYNYHSGGWVEVLNNDSVAKKIGSNSITNKYLNETPFSLATLSRLG